MTLIHFKWMIDYFYSILFSPTAALSLEHSQILFLSTIPDPHPPHLIVITIHLLCIQLTVSLS